MSEAFAIPGLRGGASAGRAEPRMRREVAVRPLDEAVRRSVDWFLNAQSAEGYWVGELEADTTLESDYLVYECILGGQGSRKIQKLANHIRRNQAADGGWNIYPGGPGEINASVKAYFALRIAGDSAHAPHMVRACKRILELGGLEATNSYTRFYLALVGELEWDWAPAIPPELMLLPKWFYVNLHEMSSWTRGIIVPLTILYALKPDWKISPGVSLDELFRDDSRTPKMFRWDPGLVTWRNFFLAVDRLAKFHERLPWKPLRKWALSAAETWIREHMERSEGVAAIYPGMMNSIYAMQAMGYSAEEPLVVQQISHLRKYEIEDDETIRIQPCVSPVWDTAIVLTSLAEAGLDAAHPVLVRAAEWLLEKQILGPGDWQYKNPGIAPGGWAFEFRNDFYPDVDDTAFVLMSLARVRISAPGRLEGALRTGVRWLVSMQNRDGGWGAFDKDNDKKILTRIPFADHNAMLDPSTPDVTARVLECLGRLGWPSSHPVIQRSLAYLRKEQAAEGPWFGRWGVNYIYGASGVLRAVETLNMGKDEAFLRAAEWLKRIQNTDGGFGESVVSYDDSAWMGRGPSTASQTAWALIALLVAYGPDDLSVRRAVQFLLDRQESDGSWKEQEFTGTGFPKVFYLKYHLYRNAFPLYALARYRNMRDGYETYAGMRLTPDSVWPRGRSWERK